MEICHLPKRVLRKNSNNFLTKISKKEYEELKESIMKYGIQEPLIVVHEVNGYYTVISGNTRLEIAEEIGMETLPCIVIDKIMIEGAFDTEIFRRHLTEEQKTEFKLIKEKTCKEIIENLLRERLLPELFEMYKQGGLGLEAAISFSKLEKEKQIDVIKVRSVRPSGDRDEGGQSEGRVDYKAMLDQKEARIERLRKERQELKDKVEENEEKIAKLEKELNKAKSGAGEIVRKEFETKIEEVNKVNESLRAQLRKKDEEIERMREESRRKESKEFADKVEKKAGVILELEERRKYMVNLIILRIDEAIKKVEEARKLLTENAIPIKDATIARDKIKSLVENSRELLSLINIAKTERMEKSVMDLRSD